MPCTSSSSAEAQQDICQFSSLRFLMPSTTGLSAYSKKLGVAIIFDLAGKPLASISSTISVLESSVRSAEVSTAVASAADTFVIPALPKTASKTQAPRKEPRKNPGKNPGRTLEARLTMFKTMNLFPKTLAGNSFLKQNRTDRISQLVVSNRDIKS